MAPKKILPTIPDAPRSIQKGSTLRDLLSPTAIEHMARNFSYADAKFPAREFIKTANSGLEPLGILERAHHLSHAMRKHFPEKFEDAVEVLVNSLTPALTRTDELGTGIFFYLPHVCFVANYGIDKKHNGGKDPFKAAMRAQYELTRRFSAEFSIRHFVVRWPERTLKQLKTWTKDKCPHVRRLCSEGIRPRLPWAMHLTQFIKDPTPVLPILEALKDDPDLYVRRSVANHLGDIAKDHPKLVFDLCHHWLDDASNELRWVIRHAIRYHAKKGDKVALKLRQLAK
jgi:3-methyladenine DNA glycosylase AlkC